MDQNVRESAGQALVSEYESLDPLNILKSGKYIIILMYGIRGRRIARAC